ncbi:NAD(P)-dependent oxidoreductase [Parabacteroides sp. Marseille-P3160]|uniref:NAD(P)-dependent oxidoreductase n=1 Tax=Parabacteroides sp. Marseille-P3160 TaxID=1917887 RepID=UPI0009BBD0E4|nr:NAD(P)H-binding protein [Parabacteroides sp. Marseille-P3160]
MKIALIGATGFVGSHILKELLSRKKYQVTAIARNIDKIDVKSPNLTSVSVDVLNTEELARALKDCKAVISAYNPGWGNPNIYEDFLKGYESIQQAVKGANIKRFIVIGGAGSLYVEGGKQLVDSDDFPKEIKPGATAARDYFEALKRETYLDWTFFSPAIQMNPEVTTGRTGKYRLGKDTPVIGKDGTSTLSVEDLAVVIVDELENKKFSRKQFTAGY